jgi:hypothetical protein
MLVKENDMTKDEDSMAFGEEASANAKSLGDATIAPCFR